MQNQNKLMPALSGGVAIGLISSVPVLNFLNCACCAGVMFGGALAVYMFRRQVGPAVTLYSRDGIELGLLAGVFGAVITFLLSTIIGVGSMEFLQELATYTDDPEFERLMNEFNPMLMQRGFALVAFGVSLVINTIFGLLGGLLGIAFFGRPTDNRFVDAQNQPSSPAAPVHAGDEDEDDIIVEDDPADPTAERRGTEPPQPEDRDNDKPDGTPLQ